MKGKYSGRHRRQKAKEAQLREQIQRERLEHSRELHNHSEGDSAAALAAEASAALAALRAEAAARRAQCMLYFTSVCAVVTIAAHLLFYFTTK